jgi:arabinogalactan endo-1,4-beta-galactosidase
MVQPGNEITPGILWPDGKLYGVGDPNEQWDKFARLLKAGVRGVQAGAGDGRVRIVLHIHCGGDFAKTKWFFDNVERRGVPYDIVGLSYYPWWHGTMDDLRENLRKTATVLGKDVFVVETAYPNRAVDVAKGKKEVANRMRWPQTPQGQAQFLRELIQVVRGVPDGRGLGVLWWYPESILVDGLHIWYGGAMALFDEQGEALPALGVFGPHPVPR